MRDRLLRDGYVILAVVFVAVRLLEIRPWADSVDAYAYWSTRTGDLYDAGATGVVGSYLYSPAFAQALTPLISLPLNVFTALWTALNAATLWFLVGRWALASLLFVPIAFELVSGNVHLLYAAAIVLGFRWSAAWALPILTKVTPGIGLGWFLVRRDWRRLGIALSVTTLIAAVSFLLDTGSWRTWIDVLVSGQAGAGQGSFQTVGWYLPVPLVPRLALAAGVVMIAALRNWRWLLPVAVTLALPVVWLNSLAILAACLPLWKAQHVSDGTLPASARLVASTSTVS